jgi:hypothetical protein
MSSRHWQYGIILGVALHSIPVVSIGHLVTDPIIIAESVLMQSIPFDLSSFVIHQYEHGGEEIVIGEQERFLGHLFDVLKNIIEVEQRRQMWLWMSVPNTTVRCLSSLAV